MKTGKKIIIALVCVLGAAAIIAGAFVILRMNRDPAKVYAVTNFASFGGNWDNGSLSGTVTTDRLQTVYLSQTQEVTEIHVAEGDRVQKGDALLSFNTTLTELELQKKELAIKKLKQEMDSTLKEYKSLLGYSYQPTAASETDGVILQLLSNVSFRAPEGEEEPVDPSEEPVDPSEEPVDPSEEPVDPSEEPIDPSEEPIDPSEEPGEPTEPSEEPTEPTVPDDPDVVEFWQRIGGNGSEEEPYLYIVADGLPLEDSFVEELLREREEVHVVFAATEDNRIDTPVLSAWGMVFTRTEERWQFTLRDAGAYVGLPFAQLKPEPEPSEDPIPVFPIPPMDGGYTKEELRRMKAEMEQKLKDLDLQIKMAEVEYEEMEKELGDGTVYAEFDGVVMSLGDPEFSYQNHEPVLKLSGGGGYSIQTSIGEFDLERYQIGQTMTVMDYWNGGQYEAVVESISTYPTSNQYTYSPNQNVSFYPMTLIVSADANLQDGNWVEINPGVSTEDDSGFYLQKAFILQENGKSYVYIRNAEQRLEKREIATGRDRWGSELEILGGLTPDDFIAFPYGKTVVENAKTVEASPEELWGTY